MESTSFRFSSLFFFFIIVVIAGYSDVVVGRCMYTISVQTGNFDDAGTDSIIKLVLGDAHGRTFTVSDLTRWGLNERSYDYFEKGRLDYFGGTAACISVCNIIMASDGTGKKPGWYLSYVEVVTTGSTSSKIKFPINRWLALDKLPRTLIARGDKCNKAAGAGSTFDIVRALE